MIPLGGNLAVSFNIANFRGEQGFSVAAVVKLSDHAYATGGFAGSTVKGSTCERVGITFGWWCPYSSPDAGAEPCLISRMGQLLGAHCRDD